MNEHEIQHQQAMILFDQAQRLHMKGELSDAILLYERSIEIEPTAEAYTFLGWAYSMLDQYEKAIALCHQAIDLDPGYGNPYNDIGSYLIELDRWEDAIPWLEKATQAARYEARQYPYVNLGHVYEYLGDYRSALAYYNHALEIDPLYLPASWAKYELLGQLN